MASEATKLLKPKKVAEMLGISPHTLRYWRCAKIEKGLTKSVLIGRQHRYDLADVNAYIEQNRTDSSARAS